MGIKHLLANVRQYAEPRDSVTDCKFVIDGCAFLHSFVKNWYILPEQKPFHLLIIPYYNGPSRCPHFTTKPYANRWCGGDYAGASDQVAKWCKLLQDNGAKLEFVFDGSHPAEKDVEVKAVDPYPNH